MTTTTLFLMYEIAQNNKVRNSRRYDTSNHFTSENKSNTTYVDGTINTDSSGGRILIVDDDPDITLSFSIGLEDGGFEVFTYNDPQDALANFKSNFYDLLLVDINMPKMNGFELCTKILEVDLNVKICFITAGDINIDGLREVYPALSTGCFIKKPISISDLVRRLKAELE
jgi:DNA-binding response OmpR family regulator